MTQSRLLQHRADDGSRRVIIADDEGAHFLAGPATVIELAGEAIDRGISLLTAAESARSGEAVDLDAEFDAGRLLSAIDHSDPARMMLAGTGLTHMGSAEGRDLMHREMAESDNQTDSMKMFLEGVEGGKPANGATGQQPEWFYKGDGQGLVGPSDPLVSPAFARDGGEEPELAGIYLIGPDGTPWRLGVALANEFSDHVTERHNYLWLAHSKLRPAALGAELLLGDPPGDLRGTSRILRDGKVAWEKPFLTGEDNMSHHLANLEAHHFKYAQFRRPGDVHVHFFGTATLSFADHFTTRDGDVFEISAEGFALPLRNRLQLAEAEQWKVRTL
ncbi:AraD1 family protein [Aurantiacibacter luteus]|uniref:FAH family protein n=1 Tax=Aurantiacibacter luteus TaxID=1581420 RepID=A0A0G9MYT3_9SPHN|nr:AraD1 family protein [Aurantiacibacter luteus]KLE35942.1 FAH family protein [Aurantiacibacter luteus]